MRTLMKRLTALTSLLAAAAILACGSDPVAPDTSSFTVGQPSAPTVSEPEQPSDDDKFRIRPIEPL